MIMLEMVWPAEETDFPAKLKTNWIEYTLAMASGRPALSVQLFPSMLIAWCADIWKPPAG